MKQTYFAFQRYVFFIAAILLITLSFNSSRAQQMEEGVFRIKVTEELASQLERMQATRTADDVLLTGIASIDDANQQFHVKGIKRVFRPAGKFEAKHRRYGLHRWYEVQMSKASSVLSALSAFGSIERVEKSEPVYKKKIVSYSGKDAEPVGPTVVAAAKLSVTLPGASNDPLLSNQWHYNNTGQAGGTPGSDIKLFQAWGIETGSPNVIVAVTDGGIQVNHPDIAANMWVNTGEIPGNNIDDDGNGFVDDINGYGFGDDTGFIAPDGHGTHVGGTVAGTTNNGIGVAGVAGGSGVGDGARLMSLAAFGANGVGGFEETYVYGADNGAVISQNSWGYTNPNVFEQAVLDGIDYFIAEAGKDNEGNQVGLMNGGIVIFAAGNDGTDNNWYPGFYESTLAVAATNNQDRKAWYSNFGTWVDIAAPGGETNVSGPPGVFSTTTTNQYAFFQGTSMACPHVSGTAALIISKYGGPGFTPDMLRGRLVQTTDNIDALNPTFVGKLGSGRLNAFAALQSNDNAPPVAIADLAAAASTLTAISLTWTAPSDPGNGSATTYDIRYSLAPITEVNFSAATPVSNPPAPKAAGGAEAFDVTGLLSGTTYHFAIKSADFFGNNSAISNVVSRSTEHPPLITITPPSMIDSLFTGETSTQILKIINTGLGPLTFTIGGLDAFATASPSNGTLPSGIIQDVAVTFDANGLLGGIYQDNLIILSNDPLNDTLVVPLTLVVTNNGSPIALATPDTLDFGGIFIGASLTRSVTVHNAGSEVLTISNAQSDTPNFVPDSIGVVTIAPFAEAVIPVTFNADAVGAVAGLLTIDSNDPDHPTLFVALLGEGLDAPSITVTPDSLAEALNTGNTSIQHLTVRNDGASDLEFAVKVSVPAVAMATLKVIDLPTTGAISSGSSATKKQAPSSSLARPSQLTIKSVGTSAATSKVLIITPDGDVSDLEGILNSFGDIEADVYPVDLLPAITLADLEGYDVVMTTNNGQWLATGNVGPDVIGDLLADYIDQGGKVIANQFVYSYDAWKLEGRFIDEQYGPFIPATTDANISTALGTILAPGHPIMQGVTSLTYDGFVQDVTLAPGATALANWANGQLFIATNSNVVALNMLPSLGSGDPLQWNGDLPTIYQNAIHFLAGPAYVEVSPKEGVVTPGSQVDLEVTFDAGGLAPGIYPTSIDLTTNVPGNELVSVPAILTVLGAQFTVTPNSLYVELEKNTKTSRTLILTNNGTSDQPFEITIDNLLDSAKNPKTISELAQQMSKMTATSEQREPVVKRTSPSPTSDADINGIEAIQALVTKNKESRNIHQMSSVEQSATNLYTTDFESFAFGDINGQGGWTGQFGNWTIEAENAASGLKHYRSLSDGLGQTRSFSPRVGIGIDPISTMTMKLDIAGSGVTWFVTPQSPTAGFVNTRVRFNPDGIAQALVKTATGSAYVNIPAVIPSGYFDLTVEVTRATSSFDVYFNDEKVFTGLGFAGSIEQVVMISLMEVEGPTFDMDDFRILDGKKDDAPSMIRVLPISGNLHAGESVELTVDFNSTSLDFGLYSSNIGINVGGIAQLDVPADLRVIGDPAIDVSPTVLAATVYYKGDTTKHFEIKNTGGRPLEYSMTVLGAGTSVANLPTGPISKFANQENDPRIQEKISVDIQRSAIPKEKTSVLQMLAGTSLLQEDFEDGSFPPAGWSVVDNEGTDVAWSFAADAGEGNYCGSGEAATVSSDVAGVAEFDTELITPEISVVGFKDIAIQYNVNYQNFANLDFLDLDIQLAGETTWTTVLSWNEDHGVLRGAPGEFVTVELDDFIGSASSFKLRWHYYDPNTGDWDWYAQVDDVVVLGNARAWLSVSPASGSVPVGEKATITANFTAEDLEAGFFVAGIVVNSNAPVNSPVGVVATLQVLNPAEIAIAPDSLYQELMIGETAKQVVTITNSGESPLEFSITDKNQSNSDSVSRQTKERRKSVQTRTEPTVSSLRRDDKSAIRQSGIATFAASPLYATDFEEFAPGDIDGQGDWAGQFGNWTVESDNPAGGLQHFRGLSDGLGLSLAFSPSVSGGSDAISSTTMLIDAHEGATTTWQIIPQSNTAQLVNTRFEFGPDGSLSTLVSDGLGGAFYTPVVATIPSGYFEFRIDIERATSLFTIYFDGEEVFSGLGFAGDIEQVVVLSSMETAGPTFDVDDLAILDGSPQNPVISFNPKSGVVPVGGSLDVVVAFDATELEEGVYSKTLSIVNNDPQNPVVSVPVVLNAMDNDPPILADVSDATVVETETLEVTFTATDEDDASIKVALRNAPSFVSLVSSGNGTITYSIHPALGDAGVYDLAVIAQDYRGERDSATFQLTVSQYGVTNFSLIHEHTGAEVLNFTDSVTIDVADPLFYKYVVRANTSPSKVGSVQFRVDGKKINLENHSPYLLEEDVIPGLSKGSHTLKAESFTKANGKGSKGSSKTAVLTVTNSATIAGFDVVNKWGNKLMDIGNGGKINIRQSGFNHITIVANTDPRVVASVRFDLNGRYYHTENIFPYSLTGNIANFFAAWDPRPGHYVLTATPYSQKMASGVAGEPVTISFDVVTRGLSSSGMLSPAAASTDESMARNAISEGTEKETIAEEFSVVLYPVPVTGALSIRTTGERTGDVELIIHNEQGQLLYRGRVPSGKLNEHRIATSELGLRSGIYYYLQFIYSDGTREVKKFFKE